MHLSTRKLLDRCFSCLGLLAIAVMAAVLLILLLPIIIRGSGAFIFRATVEHRKVLVELFDQGNVDKLQQELERTAAARAPVYAMLAEFETELSQMPLRQRLQYNRAYSALQKDLQHLLGPHPQASKPVLPRLQYGQTRWDQSQKALQNVLYNQVWDYENVTASGLGTIKMLPRADDFTGTSLVRLFPYIEANIKPMLNPRWTFYWAFLTNASRDIHFFGGIWPEVLGTIYLTLGAMLFALPLGVIAAIYLSEYAHQGRLVNLLRTCISTLAGVPSIVFGLFGLAFFINTIKISEGKSVLAGSLTLALLILPTLIRASEEAIRAVPVTYREASIGLGATKWHTICTVILPAALPGILTGSVISMGRAAGETAPIIFTAAVSVGAAVSPGQLFSSGTPALPWNIYNLSTEHEAVDHIRHVQYGMVFTLVSVVLLLNTSAIIIRARIMKKLKG